MRKVAAMVCALGGLWLARAAPAQDAKAAPPPDLDFLEYLGAWQDNDDEWLISEQWQKDRAGADRRRAADKVDGKKPGQARNDDDGE